MVPPYRYLVLNWLAGNIQDQENRTSTTESGVSIPFFLHTCTVNPVHCLQFKVRPRQSLGVQTISWCFWCPRRRLVWRVEKYWPSRGHACFTVGTGTRTLYDYFVYLALGFPWCSFPKHTTLLVLISTHQQKSKNTRPTHSIHKERNVCKRPAPSFPECRRLPKCL